MAPGIRTLYSEIHRRPALLAAILLIATLPGALAAQAGAGNGRGLDLTSRIGAQSHTMANKLVAPGQTLEVTASASIGALQGMPLFLAAELRHTFGGGVMQLPLEPNALGLTPNFFWIVGDFGPIPPVFPGTHLLSPSATFAAPAPDWTSAGPASLFIQALTIDPAAPYGLAISRTIRHDHPATPVESTLTSSSYSTQELLSYGITTFDANGDGFADVVAGKPGASPGGVPQAGEVVVWWGPGQTGSTTFTAAAPVAGAWFGSWIRFADVTNNGHPDMIVGAREEPVNGIAGAGAVYILEGPSYANQIRLQSPDPEYGARFGHEVAWTDWNGDGIVDLVVGSPRATSGGHLQAGRVYIFIAPSFASVVALECPNPQFGTKFGYAIEGADFDGDGFGDLAVGAPFHNVDPGDNTGAAYIFLSPSVAPDVSVLQPSGHALLGNAVTVGDFNGDGHPDVAFGAEFDGESGLQDAGSVHVLLGPAFTTRFEVVSPQPVAFGGFGSDVTAADFNQDGFSDLVVGEFWFDQGPAVRTGRGWVLYGPSFEQSTLLLPAISGHGFSRGRRTAAGDLNGDGVPEALLGGPFASPGGLAAERDGDILIFRLH